MQRVQNQPLWYRWKHEKSEATAVNAGEPTLGEPNNTHSYPNRRNGQDPLESPCWTDSNECSPDCYSSWVQLGGWVGPSYQTPCWDLLIWWMEENDPEHSGPQPGQKVHPPARRWLHTCILVNHGHWMGAGLLCSKYRYLACTCHTDDCLDPLVRWSLSAVINSAFKSNLLM